MKNIHKHSLFPVVVLGLTVILGLFIYLTVTEEPAQNTQESSVVVENVEPVDAGEYQEEMRGILENFLEKQQEAEEDLDMLIAAESAQFELVSLRVPTEYRETHLQVALILTQMQLTLKTGDRDITELQTQLEELISSTAWLN